MILMYGVLLFTLTIYSYGLIDPNITFINSRLWSRFLELMLQLGYYQRFNSWLIYLTIVILLFVFYYFFVKNEKRFDPVKLSIMIGAILLLSYPFLSHDFLKYMFDAKIVTLYHRNPYVTAPLSFPKDQWLRFTQWVEQPYRYGPVFLMLSLIPSWFSAGKFFLSFVLFKFMTVAFYVVAVFIMSKLGRRWGLMIAAQPLMIVDGLVNGHNDIIGLTFMIVGIYYLLQKKQVKARVYLLLSIGIKYLTLPIVFLSSKKSSIINKLIFLFFLLLPFTFLLNFISTRFQVEIQTWYFIGLLALIPFYERTIMSLNLFFFGLLMAYYPFIRYGVWLKVGNYDVRHIIIISFFLFNLVIIFLKKKKLLFI